CCGNLQPTDLTPCPTAYTHRHTHTHTQRHTHRHTHTHTHTHTDTHTHTHTLTHTHRHRHTHSESLKNILDTCESVTSHSTISISNRTDMEILAAYPRVMHY